jgi:hypothetical protein
MVTVNGLTLEEAMLADIADARAKQQRAQEVMTEAELDVKRFGDYADALERALQLRKEFVGVRYNGHTPLDAEQFRKQSIWASLKAIIDAGKGILVVNDAVSFLTEMKVFHDREQARHSVYSTIHNHRHELAKVRPGIYRLKGVATPHYTLDKDKPDLKNPMGFRVGVAKVLQDAAGQPLERNEIWKRMQAIGMKSHSKNPLGWVDWMAKQIGAEKVAPHTWRWPANR